MIETVLLIEPDASGTRFNVRAVNLAQRCVFQIVEQNHLQPGNTIERIWRNHGGEKDATGQLRVFREVLPPAPVEESEKPMFDELVLKDKIPLYGDETPNGFRRNRLRGK